jgi:hypothetical protein
MINRLHEQGIRDVIAVIPIHRISFQVFNNNVNDTTG